MQIERCYSVVAVECLNTLFFYLGTGTESDIGPLALLCYQSWPVGTFAHFQYWQRIWERGIFVLPETNFVLIITVFIIKVLFYSIP